ncbi:MAG: hypothetical protein ACK4MV_12130 [Beijerinckiaceae bacterium]
MAQSRNKKTYRVPHGQRPGYAPAVLVFLAASFLLAWPWLSGSVTIPWDAKAHFYPQLVFLANSLHEGQSPFWTPNVFGGHPQIADPQSLIFSPPYLLLALFGPDPTFAAFDAVAFGMLVAGGLALMGLFRDHGWRAEGAVVAALAFAFGGSAAWRIQHIGQILSIAWFAIALFLLMRALDRRSIVWGALAGLAAGLMIVGRDQIAWLCTWILAFVAIWRVLEDGPRWENARAYVPALGAGAIVGVVTVALPIALTLALAAHSNRAAIDFEGAAGGSLHPAALYTFISANLFGTDGPLKDYWGPPNPDFWGQTNLALARNMANVYMGALPFVALITLGVMRGGLLAKEVRVYTIASLILLLYALGKYTPFFTLAFHAPGADLFRRPADATFPLGALLAIISGYLVHRVADGDWRGTALRRTMEAFAVLSAFAACVFVAAQKGKLADALPALGGAFAWLAAALVLLWMIPRLPRHRTMAHTLAITIIGAFLFIDLRINNGPNESTALPPSVYDALRPGSRDPTLAAIQDRLRDNVAPDRRDRVEMAAVDFHWPNVSLSHGFDHWLGYNPLRLRWFAQATGAIDHVAIPDQRRWAPLFPRYNTPLADLMGVRWIATGVPAGELDKSLRPGDLNQIGRTKGAFLYENTRALPRVLFATRAQNADFAKMIETGVWPSTDFRNTVLLESPQAGAKQRAPGRARLASYENTEIVIDASSPEGGWIVLNDVWHPWWRVEVDGKPATLLRANAIFRAVEVPPGDHKVRFFFEPLEGLFQQMLGRGPRI